MDDKIANQLIELTRAFNQVGLKPMICGGLGVHLTFFGRETEVPIRTTNDIDLMLTENHIAHREIVANIVTDRLQYTALEHGRYFQFQKGEQRLDILTQPVEGIPIKGFRAILVKSRLHGYCTPEAVFIPEDLTEVALSQVWPGKDVAKGLTVSVPCLTNQMILKLFAFNDRNEGQRRNDAQAQAHAYDIYVIITLAAMNDYKQGQKFLARHSDSEIIQKAKSIVSSKFSSVDQAGWHRVLTTSSFYPDLNVPQKRERLDEAKRRIVRWFTMPA